MTAGMCQCFGSPIVTERPVLAVSSGDGTWLRYAPAPVPSQIPALSMMALSGYGQGWDCAVGWPITAISVTHTVKVPGKVVMVDGAMAGDAAAVLDATWAGRSTETSQCASCRGIKSSPRGLTRELSGNLGGVPHFRISGRERHRSS